MALQGLIHLCTLEVNIRSVFFISLLFFVLGNLLGWVSRMCLLILVTVTYFLQKAHLDIIHVSIVLSCFLDGSGFSGSQSDQ